MDLSYTEEQERFRSELRSWLAANIPAEWTESGGRGPRDPMARFKLLKEWQITLYEAGWSAPHWPVEFGGRDAGIVEQVIYHEEMALHRAPPIVNFIGMTMCGPTLIVHGTKEHKERFLPRILRGDDLWCQGFSEPNAGSDLASLQTRAVRDGDEFVVSGQKIWTSAAQIANWMFALVRTDSSASKHEGITYLLIDMASPGIDVRPIKQITGEGEFSEVFFDDVRVPASNVVGEIDHGWQIAHTTLGHERGTAFLGSQLRYERIVDELVVLAQNANYAGASAAKNAMVRDDIGRCIAEVAIMKYNGFRGLTRIMKEGKAGPEGSINRLFTSCFEQQLHEVALRLQGPQGLLMRGDERVLERGRWQKGYLRTRASTIGAGTAEIQRNVIAERVLGLPAEQRDYQHGEHQMAGNDKKGSA